MKKMTILLCTALVCFSLQYAGDFLYESGKEEDKENVKNDGNSNKTDVPSTGGSTWIKEKE